MNHSAHLLHCCCGLSNLSNLAFARDARLSELSNKLQALYQLQRVFNLQYVLQISGWASMPSTVADQLFSLMQTCQGMGDKRGTLETEAEECLSNLK